MRGVLRYVMGIALAVCVITEASAQKSGLSVSLGGASFKMEDMKYLMDNILDSYPAEGAIISSFPPYYSGSVNFIRQFYPHLRASAGYSFTSTGGKGKLYRLFGRYCYRYECPISSLRCIGELFLDHLRSPGPVALWKTGCQLYHPGCYHKHLCIGSL